MQTLQQDNEEAKRQVEEFRQERDRLREEARFDREEARTHQERLRGEVYSFMKLVEDTIRMNEEL